MEVHKREIWVDDVKAIACILVVLGHFFQSMTKASILPANDLYEWFNRTIYYFHVPLFFICGGYLYQKSSRVNSVSSWRKNVLKKAIALGVPYFIFSFATWLLKTIFASSANDQIGGLFHTLFLYPTAPYWYLYALFFIFLVTPTFKNRRMAAAGFAMALAGKMLIFEGGYEVYAVSSVLSNEIWFISGMCLGVISWKPFRQWTGVGLGILFLGVSVLVYRMNITRDGISFLLGILACIVVISIVVRFDTDRKQNAVLHSLSRYTMPIFLMHTLFAASFRAVLLKIGIENVVLHVVGGLVISFVGPIIAAEIMKKTKVLEFFLYPGRFVKVK